MLCLQDRNNGREQAMRTTRERIRAVVEGS
jgi:hypothetical protein